MFVNDNNEISKFVYDVLPPAGPGEVYFVSLSARNKYLTKEEREEYCLGRTEMFSRQIAQDRLGVFMALDRMKLDLSLKVTRSGLPIPAKALVCYINVNPSSGIKAYHEFKRSLDRVEQEVLVAAMARREVPVDVFERMPRMLMNAYQKSTAYKTYLDIDVDSKDISLLRQLQAALVHSEYHTIRTRGGWHLLVKRDTVVKPPVNGLRLHEHVKAANEAAMETGGEVVFNKNGMVPLPGTLQGECPVVME